MGETFVGAPYHKIKRHTNTIANGCLTQHEKKPTKVVFYGDQPFQLEPVLVNLVEVSNRTLHQLFLVETRFGVEILVTRFVQLLNVRLSTW